MSGSVLGFFATLYESEESVRGCRMAVSIEDIFDQLVKSKHQVDTALKFAQRSSPGDISGSDAADKNSKIKALESVQTALNGMIERLTADKLIERKEEVAAPTVTVR